MRLAQKFKDFSRKMEFKDFLRTSTKIQGLFKTVRTLTSPLDQISPDPTWRMVTVPSSRHHCISFIYENICVL